MGKRLTQNSFAGGEVSPDKYARTDQEKYSIGLKILKNGFVRKGGGVSNRAGLEFVGEVKDSSKKTRVIPFSFNTEQTYIIEVGNKYFRYIKDGGEIIDDSSNIVEIETPYIEDDLFLIKHAQNADVLTLCHTSYAPKELSRESHTDWTLEDIIIEPLISAPTGVTATHSGSTGSSTTTYTYVVTAVIEDTYEESIVSSTATVTASIEAAWVLGEYVTISWTAVEGAAEYNIYRSVNGVYGYSGTSTTTSFIDDNIEPDLTNTAPIYKNPFDPDIIPIMTSNVLPAGYTASASTEYSTTYAAWKAFDGDTSTYWQSTASFPASLQNTFSAGKVAKSVTFTTATNPPSSFYVFGSNDGGITKTTLYTASVSLSADTEYSYEFDNSVSYTTYGIVISFNVTGTTAQIKKLNFAEKDNYPSAVNYFQQRRVFAQTNNKPQTIFATQTGMYHNFNIARPLIATNAVTISLNEREVNEVRHLVAMNDLVALTSGGEWRINGSDGVFQATPPPIARLQSTYGCSDVMPVVSGNMILYVQAGGSVVRDLGYTYVSDSYDGDELSTWADHLFENKQIVDWAYSKEPNRILWCVMSDGTLNALTYDPKQQMCAWHRHETDGEFESVAVIREGYEDVPYFIVKRTINGQVKRYHERMKSRFTDSAKDGFFVDCGLKYEGSAVSTVSGLEHLEGKEVVILADGGVITGRTVVNGSVSLGTSASIIVVGLPYEFELKTLNFEGENTQGLKKIINNLSIKVDKSRPDFFVVGNDGTEQQLERSLDSINDSGYLFSGDIDAVVPAEYSTNAYVHIKQKYPLPLTILSITPEINIVNV